MNYNSSNEFKTYYCYVSRKSTFMPSLSHIEDENFERLFRQYINISTYEFLISCGFSNEKIKYIEAFIPSIDFYKKTEDFPNSIEFTTLKNSKQFCEMFNEQNDEQKRNFLNYLASINFFDSTSLLVDVGWKGTIQDNISAMLHLDMDNLKSMDIYVNLSGGNNVSTNFVLETEELLDFVYQHIDRLNARLEKLGYNTHFEMKVAADSSDRLDFVKDFIEAEARPAAGGQYIFDAKA